MSSLGTPEDVKAYVDRVAAHRGWIVNPDGALVSPILVGLAQQAARLGKPYCPCRDTEGGEGEKDIICPCAYSGQDIDETGQCFCGLFLAPGKDPAEVGSIPERRPDQT